MAIEAIDATNVPEAIEGDAVGSGVVPKRQPVNRGLSVFFAGVMIGEPGPINTAQSAIVFAMPPRKLKIATQKAHL